MGGGPRIALAVIACALVWVTPAGAASWSPPTTLWTATDPSISAISPSVAIDDAGYGVALVPEVGHGSSALVAFVHAPGGTWQEARGGRFGGGFGYAVAIDPTGNAIAVWGSATATATTIESATWSAATARWSPERTVASSPGVTTGAGFSASANAAGQIVVSWQSPFNGVTAVYGTVGATTGAFSPAVRVATLRPGHAASTVRTAIGPGGDAAIQWTDGNIAVAVRPAGGEFATDAATPITDLSSPGYAAGGAVAVDAAGDVLSTFFTTDEGDRIASSYRPAGGNFGPLQTVASRNDNANSDDIALAFDGAGSATIAWVAMVESVPDPTKPVVLESAVRPPGASAVWGQPMQLSDPFYGLWSVQIAETADGSALLAPVGIGPSADADLIFTRAPGGSFVAEGDPGGCVGSVPAMAPGGDVALGCFSAAGRSEQVLVRDAQGPSLAKLQTPALAIAGAPANFTIAVPGWAQLASGQPSWSFGDGTSGSGTAVRHVYQKAGTYTVTVTAATSNGNAPARISHRVSVLPKGTILVALGSAHVSGARITVHGTASGRSAITLTLRRRGRMGAIAVLHVAVRAGAWTRSLQLPARLGNGTYNIVASGVKVRGSKTSFHLS